MQINHTERDLCVRLNETQETRKTLHNLLCRVLVCYVQTMQAQYIIVQLSIIVMIHHARDIINDPQYLWQVGAD